MNVRPKLLSEAVVFVLGILASSAAIGQPCVGNLPASSGATCRETLAVNAASFLGGSFPGSTFDIERIVRSAAKAWTQHASARRGYEFIGSTTATTCTSVAKHLVVGRNGMCIPNPNNPLCGDCTQAIQLGRCVLAWNIECPGGGSLTEVNIHPQVLPQFSGAGYPGGIQDSIVHELGHPLIGDQLGNGGHVPAVANNPDIMAPGGAVGFGNALGPQDISFSGAWVGTGIEYVSRFTSSSWPTPAVNTWSFSSNSVMISQWGTLDLTHGFVGSLRRTSQFLADSQQVTGIDIDQVSGPFLVASGVTRRRPSSVYDPVNKLWWVAAVNQNNTIAVLRSPDRINWTNLGLLTRPGCAGIGSGSAPCPGNPASVAAQTRFPVAMAHVPGSNAIAISYTNFAPNSSNSGCGATTPFCQHELHTAVLAWNATNATVGPASFTRWHDPTVPGNISAAAVNGPAMACGTADSAGRNCEVLFTAWFTDRAMGFVRFQVSGTTVSNRTLPNLLGGLTDDDISYQRSAAGVLFAAVTGINNGVWIASKTGIGAAGFSWQLTSGGGSIYSGKGPVMRSRMEPVFDLVVFP